MRDVAGFSQSINLSLLRSGGAICIALFLGACGAGERAATGTVVRDSAGITIVENSSPVWTETTRWRVSPEPEVEIGVLEGEEVYQLNRVRGATVLSDGRIVIANAGSAELRYYDASGRYLQTVGRRGGGPGEFQFVGIPYRLAGDSLLVGADPGAHRLALFDLDGRYVESYGTPGTRALGSAVGVLEDGDVVRLALLAGMGGDDGQGRDPMVVVRHARDGTPTDTLARLPGSERYRVTERSGSMIMVMNSLIPFAREQRVALGGGLVYAGAGDSYEVEVYRTDRRESDLAENRESDLAENPVRPERLIRLQRPNRPVTSADVAEFRRTRLDREMDDNLRRRTERYLAEVTFPKEMPAYRDLRADARGNLWVEEYRAPEEEVTPRWEVFDPDGVWLGTVETPVGFQIFEIGEDYQLGLWRDELGVEYLRRYQYGPAPRSPD